MCGILEFHSKYSQTPLLRTPLRLERVSVLQSVLIKRVNFKENVWSGTKTKTVRNNECPAKRVSVKRGFHCTQQKTN